MILRELFEELCPFRMESGKKKRDECPVRQLLSFEKRTGAIMIKKRDREEEVVRPHIERTFEWKNMPDVCRE